MKEGGVEFISGALGGGKTLLAVERMVEHILEGGYVVTNVELYFDKIQAYVLERGYVFERDRVRVLENDLEHFQKEVVRGSDGCVVLVVIDEDHLYHNARDFQKRDREMLDFVTLVRKLDIALVLISQDVSNVDKQFRKMGARVTHCRNLRQFKLFGFLPCPIPLFARVTHFHGTGKPVYEGTEWKLRSPAKGLYNSKALLGSHAKVFNSLEQVFGKPLQKAPMVGQKTGGGWLEVFIVLCVTLSASFWR